MLALGVTADGTKDVLGHFDEQDEGARFWLKKSMKLRNRGVEDIANGKTVVMASGNPWPHSTTTNGNFIRPFGFGQPEPTALSM